MKKGVIVRILYPSYVANLEGIVEVREEDSDRWIVKVIKNNQTFLLSLKESDFEEIKK